MNTYSKYTANVFVAKCDTKHTKGEVIKVTTKYGKENECTVFNLVHTDKDGCFYYSIVRTDGFNMQEFAKQKAERYNNWKLSAEKKSDAYYQASKEGAGFLALGEPIKVGHHSEKRHRALIERNWNRMGKSIEEDKKAQQHESKAEYWERKANDINLSMPESVEFYEYKLEQAKQTHQGLKDGTIKREHSFSLTYAKKSVNDAEKNLETAVKLWGDEDLINQIAKEKKQTAEAKANKSQKQTDIINELGGYFAFNNEQFMEGYKKILDDGIIEQGDKMIHFGQGLYIPLKNKEKYLEKR